MSIVGALTCVACKPYRFPVFRRTGEEMESIEQALLREEEGNAGEDEEADGGEDSSPEELSTEEEDMAAIRGRTKFSQANTGSLGDHAAAGASSVLKNKPSAHSERDSSSGVAFTEPASVPVPMGGVVAGRGRLERSASAGAGVGIGGEKSASVSVPSSAVKRTAHQHYTQSQLHTPHRRAGRGAFQVRVRAGACVYRLVFSCLNNSRILVCNSCFDAGVLARNCRCGRCVYVSVLGSAVSL